MLLIINKLCDLNYFVRDTFISAIKIKYTNNQHLYLLSSLFNSVKYSAPKLQMEGFFLSLKWMFCHQNWTSYTPKIAIFCFYVKKNNKIRYYIKDLLSLPKDMKYGTF